MAAKRSPWIALVFGTALVTAVAGVVAQPSAPAVSKAESDGIIFQRQQAMKQLATDADRLGDVVAGLETPDKLPEVTKAVAQDAKDAADAFRQKIPGGRSKPEVWSNNADFEQRLKALVDNADALAKAGQAGNMTSVTGMIDSLACKACHDVYRTPKQT